MCIRDSPEPLKPAIGNWTPDKASFAFVVCFPNLSKATPFGIDLFSFAATLIFPLLIIDIDVSNMNGMLLFVGDPKQIGFVPKIVFFPPWGAIAGGAFVNAKANKFFFTACSI